MIDTMLIGKYKGRPLREMSTKYLAWLISQDHIRHRYWDFVCAILAELCRRFDDFDGLIAELQVKDPPPEYWKTAKRSTQREAERAEKLRQLEARRAEERKRPMEERWERFARLQAEREAERRNSLNAYYFVRNTQRTATDDVSDLV